MKNHFIVTVCFCYELEIRGCFYNEQAAKEFANGLICPGDICIEIWRESTYVGNLNA